MALLCLHCKQPSRNLLFCSHRCYCLRRKQRAAFEDKAIMRLYAKGMTQSAIATALGMNRGTVGSRLRFNGIAPIRRSRISRKVTVCNSPGCIRPAFYHAKCQWHNRVANAERCRRSRRNKRQAMSVFI